MKNRFFFTILAITLSAVLLAGETDSLNYISENRETLSLQSPSKKPHRPYMDDDLNRFFYRNENAATGYKVLRSAGLTLSFQAATIGVGLLLPRDFTYWETGSRSVYANNLKVAFTQPPVIDDDAWYMNFVAHPFQGSYYYNSFRSQGGQVWQSALASVAYSTAWEYLIEANFERPSIQDLIVTPILGSALGELTHYATIKMSKNGFTWYEKTLICIINPMFAINNGFRHSNLKYQFSER